MFFPNTKEVTWAPSGLLDPGAGSSRPSRAGSLAAWGTNHCYDLWGSYMSQCQSSFKGERVGIRCDPCYRASRLYIESFDNSSHGPLVWPKVLAPRDSRICSPWALCRMHGLWYVTLSDLQASGLAALRSILGG